MDNEENKNSKGMPDFSDILNHAGLGKEVAIIGLIYHAEIHDKASYLSSGKPENTE